MMTVVIMVELLGKYALAVVRLAEQLLPPLRAGRLVSVGATRSFLLDAAESSFLVYF